MWSAQRSGQGHQFLPIRVSCAWVRSSVPSRTLCCWNFGACYVLFTFINSGFTIIYLAVANTVVVTDTVTPNALFIVSACLRGIARKITFASERLAMSQLQLLCSVLCSCILCFVFFINYSLIEFISFSYFLFL